MQRPITIAIAVASFVAVMLLLVMGATGKDAVAAGAQPNYAATLDPYLPIHELRPIW